MDEDGKIFEGNFNANHKRLWKAKTGNDSPLGKTDVILDKKSLRVTEAPHLDTKALIAKLNDVARSMDHDISTILAEQTNHPILGTKSSWMRKRILSNVNSPEINRKDFQKNAKKSISS